MSGLRSRWVHTIPARNHVFMGLLLAKVPSLENIQFSVPDYWGSHDVLSRDLQMAVSQKKVLTRLEALDVHPTSDFQTSALNLYREPYFALIQPQLATFHCRGYQAFGPHAGWSQLTHIKNLAVHDCDMKASELDTIATICQSLQAFAYTALPMAVSDTWQRQRGSPKEYSAALRKHSQTLKELHLEVNFRKDTHIWNGGISSFEDFTSLESLKISPLDFAETFILPSTLGSHGFSATLPSTLKHLTISRWCWPIRVDIDWLSQAACRGELDNLETLDIEYCLSAEKDRFVMANDLRERLESDTGGPIMFVVRVRKVEDRHKGIAYSDRR
ncbi:hypothetical protein CGCTS75_v013235 [Colletotrichum tropicale]|nr:hypothetical protein CGCTS75_v013235 [Colletotrichum tropicale]